MRFFDFYSDLRINIFLFVQLPFQKINILTKKKMEEIVKTFSKDSVLFLEILAIFQFFVRNGLKLEVEILHNGAAY